MPEEIERTGTRDRSREPLDRILYEKTSARAAERRARAKNGKVVIKSSEVLWQQNRQAKVGYYLHTFMENSALSDWRLFLQEIETHSGSHLHQGGLVIYVVQGSGHTVVNGVVEPWKEGDVLLLPIQPGGVEHQHFNSTETEVAIWLAIVYNAFGDALGSLHEQRQEHPNWVEPPSPAE